MHTKNEIFEADWSGLHDVIVDTLDVKPTKKQTEEIFDKLPLTIQQIALRHGMSDTVFRDEAYVAIEELNITL